MAWQMAATGLFASKKCRTIESTRRFSRMYSGARPPGKTKASYCSAFTSSNVAFSEKLWPGFSL